MGFKAVFNWILKINDDEQLKDLKAGEKRIFTKDGHRLFPIDIPIFLVDKGFNCLGFVRISSTTMTSRMEIEASIEELFEGERKDVLTSVLRDMYG